MAQQTNMIDDAARRSLKDDLARFNCRVQQSNNPPLFSRTPRSAMQTVHWKWVDLEPLLGRLSRQLALEPNGSRRTLRLHNPGLPYGTTHTFWASIQVILPGEIASAHRHTANAFRFVMKGNGATTTVNGERYTMNEGDLVLTPSMAWHDHEYHSEAPMIWLDVLDISLMKSMHATFFENAPEQRQPVNGVPDSSWRRWDSGLMSPPGGACAGAVNPLLIYPRRKCDGAGRRLAPRPLRRRGIGIPQPGQWWCCHVHSGHPNADSAPGSPHACAAAHRQQAVLRGARKGHDCRRWRGIRLGQRRFSWPLSRGLGTNIPTISTAKPCCSRSTIFRPCPH